MLLAIDAGNTNVVFALIAGKDEIRARWRIATDPRRTGDEYAVWINQLLTLEGLSMADVTAVIISTVVPRALHNLEVLATKYFKVEPLIAGREPVQWHINVDVPMPETLGADRAVNAIAAHAAYEGDLIIIDFGTATTFDHIDYSGILLEAGRSLTDLDRLERPEDVWWLTFPELQAAVEDAGAPAPRADDLRSTVERRKRDQARYAPMTPPRVVTSDGLVPTLTPHTGGLPAGALAGSPVSPGVVEGRARVVLDPVHAALQPGEILVAPFTDPGWTPLFTQAAGLVTEVGGLMTHGSVVAREYGLPAVVGVEAATTRIVTGQVVRVHGDEGYVELVGDDTSPS